MLILGLFDFIKEWFLGIFFSIDAWLAKGIAHIYNFTLHCAGGGFSDSEYVRRVTTTLYTLIGIFVLFYVVVELIKSIMNPDNLLSGEGSLGKISSRVFIVLVLIVSVPWLFNEAMPQVQKILIGSYDMADPTKKNTGLIQSILSDEQLGEVDPGLHIGGSMLTAFIECESSCDEEAYAPWNEVKTGSRNISEYTANIQKIKDNILSYNYTIILSTICLILAIVLMTVFLFDVIKAVCQIWFLEILSPIPIMMYLLPKHPMFDRWVDSVKNAYISIALRIASASLLILAINTFKDLVMNYSIGTGEETSGFATVILTVITLIGVLMFVIELPKLVSQIFGFKLDGGLNFIGKKALNAGKSGVMKTAAAIGGGFVGGVAASRAARKAGYSTKGAFRSGFKTASGEGWRSSNAGSLSIKEGVKLAADAYGGSVSDQRAAAREQQRKAALKQREYSRNTELVKKAFTSDGAHGKAIIGSAFSTHGKGSVAEAAEQLVTAQNNEETYKATLSKVMGNEKATRAEIDKAQKQYSYYKQQAEKAEKGLEAAAERTTSASDREIAQAYLSKNRDKL